MSEKDGGAALTYAFKRDDAKGYPTFTWSLIGPDGGVHIWARANDAEWVAKWGERYIGGVECHWPAPPDESHHADCWLLKGPCRHDGSSLYFSERIAPMLHPDNIESESIGQFVQSILHDWYRSNIAARTEAPHDH